MIPPWVIEEVEKRRREEEESRPRISIEVPRPPPGWEPEVPAWRREPVPERGVYRIEV